MCVMAVQISHFRVMPHDATLLAKCMKARA